MKKLMLKIGEPKDVGLKELAPYGTRCGICGRENFGGSVCFPYQWCGACETKYGFLNPLISELSLEEIHKHNVNAWFNLSTIEKLKVK